MNGKKILVRILIIALVIITLFSFLSEMLKENDEPCRGNTLVRWMENAIMDLYLPGISARENISPGRTESNFWNDAVLINYPVLWYCFREQPETDLQMAESDYEQLLLLEGRDEGQKGIAEGELEYDESALHLDESIENAVLEENGAYLENQTAQGNAGEQPLQQETAFVPAAQKAYSYRWEDLRAYDDLVKAFYAVDSTTTADEKLLDLDNLLSRDMRLQGSADEPQILIYHTHSQEAFADSVPGDESTTIVGAGEYLAQLLREEYGYNVLHHTAGYDVENRDYAYSNSLPEIEKLLADNPSIEVVIDLHRDAVRQDRKLVVDLQGKPTAQFMFFNGLSRTKKGEISYLENPYLADNLAFSFQMQAACNEYYPGVARRIYLKAYRYNMHVCPKTLLIELGAQTNTVEEIKNACEPLAHVLSLVLDGKEPDLLYLSPNE